MPAKSAAPKIVRSSAPISRRIAGARRSLMTVELLRRLAITVAVGLGLLVLLLVTDWLTELPLATRKGLIVAAASITGLLALWAIAALVTQRRSDDEIALMVERKSPRFDSRLISAVQFAEGKAAVPEGAPKEMVKAMVAETESAARAFQFKRIVDPRKFARAALVLLGVIVLAGAGAFLMRDVLPALIGRAFGQDVPIPRETRIVEASGDTRIGVGDPVELAFTTEGVIPATGSLAIKFASGRKEDLTLKADPAAPGRFAISFDDVPETFTFRATFNDARTEKATVTAIERPTVESLAATQDYPDFTGLQSTSHAPGDFALFPGSQLDLTVNASKPLGAATLRFVGTDTELDLEVDVSDPKRASAGFTIPAENLVGFTVLLTDKEQMDSKDNTVYRVSLLSDRAPEVRITYPRRAEELVTRKARVLVRYEATDRFGIAALNLHYARTGGQTGTVPVEIAEGAPKAVNGSIEWELAAIEPGITEGEIIEYWLEATDQNASSANVGESEHLLLRVVTPEEKRADLLGRASDAIGSVGEATSDQERLNKDLEGLIRENANAPRPEVPDSE